jgi:hypothetical protein
MAKSFYDIDGGVPGVELATEADESEIYALLLMLHAENGFFTLNPEKVIAGIRWATKRQGGIIFVIKRDGHVIASLGMTIAQEWYSDDEFLLERWNYVHPAHRHSDYARKLIEQGKWSSDWFKRKKGYSLPFHCGINSLDRTEAKIRLYARHMVCMGAYFAYGQPPRLNHKVETAWREIEETNRKRSEDGTKTVIVPTVETILRLSKREREHV